MTIRDALYRRLPGGMDVMAASVRRSPLALAWHQPAMVRVQGRSMAGRPDASVILAGGSPVNSYILERLFDGDTVTTPLGRCWLGALPKRLRSLKDEADLVIARVETGVSRRLFGDAFLRMPEIVDAQIAVPHPDERWPRSKSARSNVTRVKKSGLGWSISHDPADFDFFYDKIYEPYVRDRFGASAAVASRGMLRFRFAQGGLQWILHGSDRVAGQLLESCGRQLRCVVVGYDPAYDANRLGVGAATMIFAVHYAQSQGFDVIDLGGSRPSLHDPVLLNKRFWGADFMVRDRATHDLVVAWPTWNDMAANFLTTLAPVHREDRDLVGFTAPAEEPESSDRLIVRGLKALFVVDDAFSDGMPTAVAGSNGAPIVRVDAGSSEQIVRAARRFLAGGATDG